MLKLTQPNYGYVEVLDLCRDGITGNRGLLQKVNDAIPNLQAKAQEYEASGVMGELYTIEPLQIQDEDDPVVLGQLKKSDLIKLYGNYLVGNKKPARAVYDSLMVAADEKCPFCGGIGRPRNLDHYLPKAHFPQFSIIPVNLVPSCRDCNMDGKGEGYAAIEDEQVIQPYLDNDRYFNEQWLSARFLPSNDAEPGVIEYFVSPPEHWEDSHKKRVEKHFNDFELGLRFSKEAGPRLVTLMSQYRALLGLQISAESSKSVIFQKAVDESPFVNHWERVMCLTLISEL
ncbi:HNH endonuclease signature motif containing protein [Marinomonas sp. TI.3.20]|uniref:HNH endonuclease n=1 Tax=Marinomonas sp. TI.3.20 TaxID=3121296 RepID=UPI00311F3EBF